MVNIHINGAYMNNVLEVNNLSKTFKGFSIDSISFNLPAGSIMGFVGQNGAGKTTTIRLILNMLKRDAGEIKVFGLDNIRDELEIKQNLGILFDDLFFIEMWTVKDIEDIIKEFYKLWDSKLYRQYLDKFNLPFNKIIKELSRGMKIKLMLAVAMSHNARLLILDEPTSGLDPVARNELLDIFKEYIAEGERSILFSTHITSDLGKVADYITLIDYGKLFYSGNTRDLINNYLIVRGNPDILSAELKKNIMGLTINQSVFVGMIKSSVLQDIPKEIVNGIPTIDEILIYISKGMYKYE
jgi:ABC-2 type transport system ATP-binding protein